MAFTGPGIAVDWLDIEGPLHAQWPPDSHRLLFGQMPLLQWNPAENAGVRAPVRKSIRQIGAGLNRADPDRGVWTSKSAEPLVDAERLLRTFLPKAFRRPVEEDVCRQYVGLVGAQLKAGDCFETAMRSAYRAALCSPDFLYHLEPADRVDNWALASRLSYFLWSSMPDARLAGLAADGTLRNAGVLRGEVERLLKDPKSQRFIEDFLGQWLKLRCQLRLVPFQN